MECKHDAYKIRSIGLLHQGETAPFCYTCEPLEMLFPITPPLTPILEGVGQLVGDRAPMLAANMPPQSPVLDSADRESCIWITHTVEVPHEVGFADEVQIKYEVEVMHETEQVRGYYSRLSQESRTHHYLTEI